MTKVGWLPPVLWAASLGLALLGGAMLPVRALRLQEPEVASPPQPRAEPAIHSAADIVAQIDERARLAAEAQLEQELEVQPLVDEEAPVEEAVSEFDQQALADSFFAASASAPYDVIAAPRRAADARELERSDEASAELIAVAVRGQRADDLEAATTLIRQEEYRAARILLKECLSAAPANADCHKLLGTTYARLDERDLAAAEYRAFLKLAPEDDPQYSRVQDILAAYDQQQKP